MESKSDCHENPLIPPPPTTTHINFTSLLDPSNSSPTPPSNYDTYIANYLQGEPCSYTIICQKIIKSCQRHFFCLKLGAQDYLDINC